MRAMEIRQSRLDRGGRGYLRLGFSASTPAKAAQWLISGGFQTTARLRRASEQRNELGSVNDALDCFQWKGRGSAGAGRAAVSFGPTTASSIPCDKIERGRVGAVRRVEVERMEEKGGRMAHRWWRIRPGELADGRRSNDELCRLEMIFAREKKRRSRRTSGGFYRRPQLAGGARVWLGGEAMDGGGRSRAGGGVPARGGR
jgi:hypothetical protein